MNSNYLNDNSLSFAHPITQPLYAIKSEVPVMQTVLDPNLNSIKNISFQENKIAKKTTSVEKPLNKPQYTQLFINQPQVTHSETKVDKEKKIILCEICQKTFSTVYNKRRHEEMVHKDNVQVTKKFKCSSCDKMFSSIYNKTRHENVHKPITERLKFKCEINNCNKSFTTPFILKTHIKKSHKLDANF